MQPRVIPMAISRLKVVSEVSCVKRYQLQAASTKVHEEARRVQVGIRRVR